LPVSRRVGRGRLALDENFDRLAEELAAEGVAVLRRALVEDVDPLVDDRPADEVASPARRGRLRRPSAIVEESRSRKFNR
jgi:hypothetical protein